MTSKSSDFADRLDGLSGPERFALVSRLVRETTAVTLDLADAEPVDETRTFEELGFDSLLALEFAELLSQRTGLSMSGTLVFEAPTPGDVARYLLRRLPSGRDPTPTEHDDFALANTNERAVDEPIAILSMACRFPGGVSTPQQLWDLIAAGVGATGEFPTDRGWGLTGTGGFLHDAADFDNEFFRIAPREAMAMDPQQRLLLEVCWEAVEGAGIDPTSLAGSDTGTFVGVIQNDYGARPGIDGGQGHLLTGTAASVASGRIAYTLGLQGPTLSVDTACSSSLVALHLAVQSLHRGESSLAMAGGATVMTSPFVFNEFERQGGLAADGLCKAFSDSADGTAWSEGVGILVLARLSEAQRKGYPILGLIRGSAVNSDGHSNGLTAPNVGAQERVMGKGLAAAGVEPAAVELLEAHGTGTKLGDPIEAQAIWATYGVARSRPLWLGSLKSNIGHTQAAAGVAGVMKAVLALRNEVIPATLHVEEPSTMVDWSGPIKLAVEARPWSDPDQDRLAAVSSFGISGTNAHVILQEAPAPVEQERMARSVQAVLWPISAKSPESLTEQADRLRQYVESNQDIPPGDIAASLGRRAVFEHRFATVGNSTRELAEALTHCRPVQAVGNSAFVFSGQGAQRALAGAGLRLTLPVFRDALEEVCFEIDTHLDRSILSVAMAAPESEAAALLDDTRYTQPAIFALQVAQYRLLESVGVRPDYLLGHSIGEIGAAHVAGALSLADASALVVARGRMMNELMPPGAMIAVACTESDGRAMIDGYEQQLSVAAVNGRSSVVLSGEPAALAEIVEKRIGDRRHTWLQVGRAFHSPAVDCILDPLRDLVEGFTYGELTIPVVSSVTGRLAAGDDLASPGYWVEHARQPVRFADGLQTLQERGVATFAELGPGPVLSPLIATEVEGSLVQPLLRPGHNEHEHHLHVLAALWSNGMSMDLDAVAPEDGRFRVLPAYAFQRRRFWLESTEDRTEQPFDHPILTSLTSGSSAGEIELAGSVSTTSHPWLGDHKVGGEVVLPGAALVELALSAANVVDAPVVEELTLHEPIVVSESEQKIRVVVGAEASGRHSLTIRSGHVIHATGFLTRSATPIGPRLRIWPPPGATELDRDHLGSMLRDHGFEYGPAFSRLVAAWRRGDETFAELTVDASAASQRLQPAILDSAMQALVQGEGDGALPFEFAGVEVSSPMAGPVRARLTATGDRQVSAVFFGANGEQIAAIERIAFRPVPHPTARNLFLQEWSPVPGAAAFGGEITFVDEGLVSESVDLAAAVERHVSAFDETPDVVVVSARTGPEDRVEAAHNLVGQVLRLMQNWLESERYAKSRLVVATTLGVVVSESDPIDPAAAAAWGFLRSAQNEYPDRLVLVDIDDRSELKAVVSSTLAVGEPVAAIRDFQILTPSLRPAPLHHGERTSSLSPTGTVLITGGTGGLGRALAWHLAKNHEVRSIHLASRRGPEADGVQSLVDDLTSRGVTVRVSACDVSNRDEVRRLVNSIGDPPLAAVFHLAGVLDDGVVASLNDDRLQTVLRPKVDGSWHLHELTADHDLSAFVVFSSIAGVLGSPGQAGYAAANTFADALAHHRRQLGLTALSIAWGPWRGSEGMAERDDSAATERLRRLGVESLNTDDALSLLDQLLAQSAPAIVAADLRLEAAPKVGGRPVGTQSTTAFADAVEAAPPEQREAVVQEMVRAEVATVLGHQSGAAINPDQILLDLGFDSLMSVELRTRLVEVTGLQLSATIVFDHPTVYALAAHIEAQFEPDSSLSPLGLLAEFERLERAVDRLVLDEVATERLQTAIKGILAKTGEDEAGGAIRRTELIDKIDLAAADKVSEVWR